MIGFDELRIENGEPFHKDKWNGLLDWVAENPLNLTDEALRLRVPNGAGMKIAAEKQGTQPGAADSITFYAENSAAGAHKRLLAISDSGELVLSAQTNPAATAAGSKCRAMADLGNQLGINHGRDFSNGVLLGGKLRVQASNGYVEVSPASTSVPFVTESNRFTFNKEVRVGSGKIGSLNEDLLLCTGGNVKMTLSSNGNNVGIGGSSPHFPLSMGTGLNSIKLALYNNSDGSVYYGMGVTSGRFYFNIGNPQAKYVFLDRAGSGANEIFHIEGNGNVRAAGDYLRISDGRLKKDIEDFHDGLAVVEKMAPVSFEYNGLGNTVDGSKEIGFIAQDLEKVAPYLLVRHQGKIRPTDEEELELLSIKPMGVIYLLVNAVKELSRQLTEVREKAFAHNAQGETA